MATRSVRKFLFRLHAWVGLNLSILLALMFATGTLLVFSTEIEAFQHKGMRAISIDTQHTATSGEIYDAVRAAYPDVSLSWIERDNVSWIGDATMVRTAWGEEVYIWTDPVTAEVLGATSRGNAVMPVIRAFHDGLLTGNWVGRLLATSTALALLVSIVTGLITYRQFWRGFFRMPSRHLGPRGWWGGLHRLTALWALPFLIVICLTGLYYFLESAGVPLDPHYPRAAQATERDKRMPAGFDGADLDRATAVATEILPDLEITSVGLPFRITDGIKFEGQTDAILAEASANLVSIDPATFEPLVGFHASELSAMSRLIAMIRPLHFGQWGGLASRVLWLIFGTLSTCVALFGVMIYAARVLPASEDISAIPGPFRRAWSGMNPVKWLLVLMLAGALAAGIYRYGPANDKWVRQWHPTPAYDAQLWVRGNLRAGKAIELRFQITLEGSREATVQLGDGRASAISLKQDGDTLTSTTTLRADETDNIVTLTIPDLGADGTVLQWRLGRPLL